MLQNIRQLLLSGRKKLLLSGRKKLLLSGRKHKITPALWKEKDVQICVARLVLEMHYSFISSLLCSSQLVSNIFTTPAILELLSSGAGRGVSEGLQGTKETQRQAISLSVWMIKKKHKKEGKQNDTIMSDYERDWVLISPAKSESLWLWRGLFFPACRLIKYVMCCLPEGGMYRTYSPGYWGCEE